MNLNIKKSHVISSTDIFVYSYCLFMYLSIYPYENKRSSKGAN